MYGSVIFEPRPSANSFDYTIMWDMTSLRDVFPIAWYPLRTSVSDTYALKLHLQLAINKAKTDKYTFIKPRAQIVQRNGQIAVPTSCRYSFAYTISIQSSDVNLIVGMQYVRVPFNDAKDEK